MSTASKRKNNVVHDERIKQRIEEERRFAAMRRDAPLNFVHGIVIALMTFFICWNGLCAFWWMRSTSIMPSSCPEFIPYFPDVGVFFGVLFLCVVVYACISLYALATKKKYGWFMSILALFGSSAVKYLFCVPLWALDKQNGGRGDVLFAIDAVLALSGIGVFAYYFKRRDNFTKCWTVDLGHHLSITAVIVLTLWCTYCAPWWLGTRKMIFTETWSIGYPNLLPLLPSGGWIMGLMEAALVIYCIITVYGLIGRKKYSATFAMLAFPITLVNQILAYWYECVVTKTPGALATPYNEVGYLLITVVIGVIGGMVFSYYKSRRNLFTNGW